MHHFCSFPKHRLISMQEYITTRASVSARNNAIQKQKQQHYCNKSQAKNAFLIWGEKRKSQIKSASIFKSNPIQPLSNQLKSLYQPNHYILICFKYLSHQIFESPLIWTQLRLFHLSSDVTKSLTCLSPPPTTTYSPLGNQLTVQGS